MPLFEEFVYYTILLLILREIILFSFFINIFI